jgi:tetratricopeptide (TPR) repeat protein
MRKFAVLLLNISFICGVSAQPLRDTGKPPGTIKPWAPDRNIVMDFFQNQQFAEAIDYLQPAFVADSSNINTLSWLGYASFMNDDKPASERYNERIFQLDSNNISALSYLVTLNKEDAYVIAMGYTARLIRLQPAKALWWRTMGDLFRRSKELDSAIVYHRHAYELAPADYKNAVALADALIEKKLYPQADSVLDVSLARDSMNLSLLKSRVHSAYLSQDYAAAIVPGERIRQQNVAILNALTWLSLSYYNLKKYPECVSTCEYMLANGLDVESIYYYESRAYAKMKEYKKSNDLLGICLAKAISHTAEWYYNDLGSNYEELKDYKAAVAHLDTAYYLFREPIMLYNCGRISETELHNKAMARKYFTLYLATAHPVTAEEKKAYEYVRLRWGAKALHGARVK